MTRDRFRVGAGAALLGLVWMLAAGCTRPWDDYDPRVTNAASPLCGGVGVLADDFDDGQLDGRFWLDANGSAELRDGQLALTLPSDTSECSHFGSEHAYELSGRAVGLELVSMPAPPAEVAFRFWLHAQSGNTLETTVSENMVQFIATSVGEPRTLATQHYDPAQHRFLRMREADGTVYWETSADGAAWTERAKETVARLFDVRYVSLELAAQGLGNGSTVAVLVDNLLGGGAPTEVPCACSALSDDFEDGTAASAWSVDGYSPDWSMTETGGELVARLASGSEGYCSYDSVSVYDLRGSAVSVELTGPPDATTQGYFDLVVGADEENYLYARVKPGELHCTQVSAGECADLSFIEFSPAEHRWIRFREQDGTVYFEVSPDGRSWQAQTSTIQPFPVDAVSVRLQAGTLGVPTAPVEIRVDNLNVAP